MHTAMKSRCIVILAMLLVLVAGISWAREQRAIYIDIYGIGPAVDAKAYKQVRRVIGNEIVKGNLEKFVVYGYGFEGGFGACVELSPFAAAGTLEEILIRFNTIQPDPTTTAYVVHAAPQCE